MTKEGAGVRIFIQDPEGRSHKFIIKMNYPISNNEVEYEALVRCLSILQDMGAEYITVHSDSQLVTHQILGTCERKEGRMIAYANIVED